MIQRCTWVICLFQTFHTTKSCFLNLGQRKKQWKSTVPCQIISSPKMHKETPARDRLEYDHLGPPSWLEWLKPSFHPRIYMIHFNTYRYTVRQKKFHTGRTTTSNISGKTLTVTQSEKVLNTSKTTSHCNHPGADRIRKFKNKQLKWKHLWKIYVLSTWGDDVGVRNTGNTGWIPGAFLELEKWTFAT